MAGFDAPIAGWFHAPHDTAQHGWGRLRGIEQEKRSNSRTGNAWIGIVKATCQCGYQFV